MHDLVSLPAIMVPSIMASCIMMLTNACGGWNAERCDLGGGPAALLCLPTQAKPVAFQLATTPYIADLIGTTEGHRLVAPRIQSSYEKEAGWSASPSQSCELGVFCHSLGIETGLVVIVLIRRYHNISGPRVGRRHI